MADGAMAFSGSQTWEVLGTFGAIWAPPVASCLLILLPPHWLKEAPVPATQKLASGLRPFGEPCLSYACCRLCSSNSWAAFGQKLFPCSALTTAEAGWDFLRL